MINLIEIELIKRKLAKTYNINIDNINMEFVELSVDKSSLPQNFDGIFYGKLHISHTCSDSSKYSLMSNFDSSTQKNINMRDFISNDPLVFASSTILEALFVSLQFSINETSFFTGISFNFDKA